MYYNSAFTNCFEADSTLQLLQKDKRSPKFKGHTIHN